MELNLADDGDLRTVRGALEAAHDNATDMLAEDYLSPEDRDLVLDELNRLKSLLERIGYPVPED